MLLCRVVHTGDIKYQREMFTLRLRDRCPSRYVVLLYGWIREGARRSKSCVPIGYPSEQNGPILPAFDLPRRSRKKKFSFWPYSEFFIDLDFVSGKKKNAKKNEANIQPSWPRTWSITYISPSQVFSVQKAPLKRSIAIIIFTLIVRRGLHPDFFSSPSTRAISVVAAVPVEASTAPCTQESLWLPIKTYRSGSSRP